MLNPIRSICIVRLSAIGDVCHAVSAVQAIQRQHPEAEITWIIGKVEAALLKGLPGVRFVVFDKSLGFKAYLATRRALNGQRFDVLLQMQVAARANLLAAFIKAKRKIGFDKARSKEGHSLFINERIAPRCEGHVLEGFFDFAQALGVAPQAPLWQMPIAQSDRKDAEELLEGVQRFVVISPAASKAERNWLPERYAKMAEFAQQKGFAVVLTGGPTDMEKTLAHDIMQQTDVPIVNLVGKTSLKALLVVLEKATCVIAPDTGPAHMAVTMNTPVIGLYAHSNPKRTGPYLYQDYVCAVYQEAIEAQQQKPLAEIKFGTRAKGADLMAKIQLENVKAMFLRVLEEQAG